MNNMLNYSKRFMKRNAAIILTGVGVVGVVATTITAIKATPKALVLLEEKKEEKEETLSRLEILQVSLPAYIPTILLGTGTIACILGANILNKKAQASIMSAYALLDRSYKDYKEKVIELYGEDASNLVRENIAKDNYEKEEIENEDDGKQLFYDEFSKRYFRATNETVLRAEYEMNRILNEAGGAYLNEYYDLVGLPQVDYGEYLGWSAAQMYEMYWESWLYFHHTKTIADDGTEFWIIDFTEPFPDYDEY